MYSYNQSMLRGQKIGLSFREWKETDPSLLYRDKKYKKT